MATPKSKESKRKLRRWQFEVIVMKEGKEFKFMPPAITIGMSADAQKAAKDIYDDLANEPQFKDKTFKVVPVGFETVSQTVLNQINGLSDEMRLITRALKNIVTTLVKQELGENVNEPGFDLEKTVTERVGQSVIDARNEMLAEKKAAMDAKLKAMGIEAEPLPEVAEIPEEYKATATDLEGNPLVPGPDGTIHGEVLDPGVQQALMPEAVQA